MTVIRFLITPLKWLLFLALFAALIYFRVIIFQPHINQYINAGLSLVEDMAEISIPSHQAPVNIEPATEIKVVVKEDCPNDQLNVADSGQEEITQKDKIVTTAIETMDTPAEDMPVALAEEKESVVVPAIAAQPVADQVKEPVNSDAEKLIEAEAKSNNAALPDSRASEVSIDKNDMLVMARQAFWVRNFQDSEKRYLDIIGLDDGDADIYGELGNVYYSQGKWQQAGKAYYEAAIRLLASNGDAQNSDRVSYLLRVIQGLDTDSAEKLRNKISG
ncbi:MAG: tetratricopeptide repeat protein [Gammaproteobacteria bacterium]|nr:tetratricopeptide repeat protein [Gammaproteobacteria bacterium]